MSTGLPAAPNGGMNLRNAASRSGGIVISDNLLSMQASDNNTPEPPAPVMMTTFSPFGVGNTGMPRANSSMSRNDRARITPDWLNTSSYILSLPASAPVCELAALAPAEVRPAFSTTIGFFFDTRLATSAKARPSFRSSQCCAMIWVLSSCSKKVNRSSSSISDLLPRPTIAETPILAEREKPMIAMPMPPDCDDNAAEPLTSKGVQNVAHRFFHV